LRAFVYTDTAIAAVLGVSRSAVTQAEQRGRIQRWNDQCWEVFSVVERWRDCTSPSLQRGRMPTWLNGYVPLTDEVRVQLVRRARAAKAAVLEQVDGEWRPLADVGTQLRSGVNLTRAGALELEEAIAETIRTDYFGLMLLEWSEPGAFGAGEELAKRLGIADVAKVTAALRAVFREVLADMLEV
jgi:hypothetical protein